MIRAGNSRRVRPYQAVELAPHSGHGCPDSREHTIARRGLGTQQWIAGGPLMRWGGSRSIAGECACWEKLGPEARRAMIPCCQGELGLTLSSVWAWPSRSPTGVAIARPVRPRAPAAAFTRRRTARHYADPAPVRRPRPPAVRDALDLASTVALTIWSPAPNRDAPWAGQEGSPAEPYATREAECTPGRGNLKASDQ